MFGQIKSPKSDLHSQATERRTIFPQLALQAPFAGSSDGDVLRHRCGRLHLGAGAVESRRRPARLPPRRPISDTQTSGKTSRLPISDLDRVCRGQSWGEETADCLSEIARENGKAAFKVRLIADAAPADLDTPNIF